MKTKDKIIQASITLFNEQGEQNVTTNHIADYLGISPGNLYYHFRNKEDIIQSIFAEYQHHLENAFIPYNNQNVDFSLLINYLDSMFNTLWKYRFIYANLVDLLNRDPIIKQKYQYAQQKVLNRCTKILLQLIEDDFFQIDELTATKLADTIKMMISFWISYQLAHTNNPQITQNILYEGLLRIIMLFKAYTTEHSLQTLTEIEKHYQKLIDA